MLLTKKDMDAFFTGVDESNRSHTSLNLAQLEAEYVRLGQELAAARRDKLELFCRVWLRRMPDNIVALVLKGRGRSLGERPNTSSGVVVTLLVEDNKGHREILSPTQSHRYDQISSVVFPLFLQAFSTEDIERAPNGVLTHVIER